MDSPRHSHLVLFTLIFDNLNDANLLNFMLLIKTAVIQSTNRVHPVILYFKKSVNDWCGNGLLFQSTK